MDFIQRAVEKKQHISKRESLNAQTWEEFKKRSVDRKLFLFGAGAGTDFFLENCKEIYVEGVIDNDIRKQGFFLGDFCGEAKEAERGRLKISSIAILKRYECDEVVVLITSTNYYEQIIEELEKIGIQNYHVLLIMEANKRNQDGYSVAPTLSREDYAEHCCQEEIQFNKIVFYAFGHYADHGKYITEALLKMRKDLDIVWLVKDMTIEVPVGVRKICAANWKRHIYEMETAHVWIYNMVVPRYMIKRPGQIYIQTKHWASVTLKKFYLDSATIQGEAESVNKWKYNSEIMDYIITGSDFDTQSSRRGFSFQKEVWQIGSPRSDALFRQEECKKKVYDFYHLSPKAHTLIYAPTYRYSQFSSSYQHEFRGIDLDFRAVKEALEKRFGGEWYIILRLHPSVAKEGAKMAKDDFIVDADSYEDSQELVSACDVMISDYSSIMFEPSFVKKPVFLFATDKENYIDKEYDLLIEYDELPFPLAESNEELVRKIEQFEQDEYEKNLKAFLAQYGVKEDGHASERAAKRISDLII